MKTVFFMLLCGSMLLVSGCRSGAELDRKKTAPRQTGKVRAVPEKRSVNRKKSDSNDPVFDMLFRRKQEYDGASVLSDSEKAMLRRSSGEESVRSVRGGERIQENNRQKDWVFGTKNGRYL